MSGANYIYLVPHRNRGKGARSRFKCFLRLDDSKFTEGIVQGDVVDEYGRQTASGFELEREYVRHVYRAIPADNGRLIPVIPREQAA